MPPAKKVAKATSTPTDDPYVTTLLGKISEGKHVMSVRKGETIFSQGDRADAIYFVQSGRVKVSVVSSAGKEAVLAMLGPHDFFGEGVPGRPISPAEHGNGTGTGNGVPGREARDASRSS